MNIEEDIFHTKMFSISFIHKIFLIIIIFITTTTSLPKFFSFPCASKPKLELYQMVKDKNQSYFTYLEQQKNSYEIKMDIVQYYNTIHNLDYRKMPSPYEKYSYKAYLKKIREYCENEFITLGTFKDFHDLDVLKDALNSIKTSIDTILKSDINLKNVMIEALEVQPEPTVKNASLKTDPESELANYISYMVTCIQKNYLTGQEQPSFINCFCREYDNNYTHITYKSKLLSNLKKKLPPDQYKTFESGLKSFKEKTKKFLPRNDTSITLRDVYLGLSMIYHHTKSIDDINLSGFLFYYKGVKIRRSFHVSKDIVRPTDEYIINKLCLHDMDYMDKLTYTATKLSYLILPGLSDYNLQAVYKTRRQTIIDYLVNIDKHNPKYYKECKIYTEKISDEYFKSMIKRRAMPNENYTSYVMRMNMRGYLPLPKNIWTKERAVSHNSDVQEITNKELTEELRNHNGT